MILDNVEKQIASKRNTSLIARLTPDSRAFFLARFARVASLRHHPHTTTIILHLSKLPFLATSRFGAPKLCNTPAHPYHTVGPVSRCFPAFGRQRTLITPLDPSPAVTFYLSARKKKKDKSSGVCPFIRSPLSEKSAAIVRESHYSCRCNEIKPYDICDVTTRLEADDVSIRITESDSYTEEEDATGVRLGGSIHRDLV
ncbi:hypothetical protein Y032_0014g2325 [Ancylostoma ceylanicum]|uniref:Uncharacterized protein n=1 Tax=Ancylostoma ceylanicum TaxID=53326 RepID=A0A016VBL5_9BILA|nr:hypothetical protein Y032_0014g2325 [Ancylostoma ceylanicum]